MASSPKDISGQRFGKLVAKRKTDEKANSTYLWECNCDCGNVCKVSVNSLTSGKTKSCGCLRTPNFTGQKIGRLFVKGIHSKGRDILWQCTCDCGNITTATTSQLKAKIKCSCGCLEKENKKKIAGNNFIDITGKRYGSLIVLRKSGQNKKQISWECRCDCGKKTIVQGGHLRSGHTKSCGCLLESAKERWKTISQSKEIIKKSKETFLKNDGIEKGTSLSRLIFAKNSKKKNNKTGTTGVSYAIREEKYRAYITLKGKQLSLGYYENKQEAINARKMAEAKYFDPILNKYGKIK